MPAQSVFATGRDGFEAFVRSVMQGARRPRLWIPKIAAILAKFRYLLRGF
jgi:hypothetical protein